MTLWVSHCHLPAPRCPSHSVQGTGTFHCHAGCGHLWGKGHLWMPLSLSPPLSLTCAHTYQHTHTGWETVTEDRQSLPILMWHTLNTLTKNTKQEQPSARSFCSFTQHYLYTPMTEICDSLRAWNCFIPNVWSHLVMNMLLAVHGSLWAGSQQLKSWLTSCLDCQCFLFVS